ncbi:hypothetical protein D9757_007279 [Collybiopsis confluens]|uniref:tRNA (cytosine(38)-C(5))-methyltransferase n=1 Tax=Collybiopsis confluens TaxID=2823264 RepID=A0A8H5HGB9_9AGAR|nr:hypothetical protein D9757_007279 [Collybiopsis confluens]
MTCSPDIRTLEFYSGIGGLHLALRRSKIQGTVVKAFDWDQNAANVYDANHGPSIATKRDISEISAQFLTSFQAALWILSPACQPYTVLNPEAKGSLDPRAKSFLHLIQDVLPQMVILKAHPTHMLIENVGGFETSTTRHILLSQLHSLGYTTAEFLLTPLQFSIPNSRLRYYLLAKTAPFAFPPSIQPGVTYRSIPLDGGQSNSWVDPREDPGSGSLDDADTTLPIRHYLDSDLNDNGPHPHSVPDKVLEKWGRLFDIALPFDKRTCCFTRGYTRLVARAGSIIQMNQSLDTTQTFDAFLSAQTSGQPDAVRILHPLRLRYFTPSELLRIFHFNPPPPIMDHCTKISSDQSPFIWPEGISTKTKYRLIGNSVNVHVVTELINFLYEESEVDGQ